MTPKITLRLLHLLNLELKQRDEQTISYSRFKGVSSSSLSSLLHRLAPAPVTVTLTFSSPSLTLVTSHDSLMRSQSTSGPDSRGILTRYIRARPFLIACGEHKDLDVTPPLGENCALVANQSVDCRATTLFIVGLNFAKV